MRHASEMTEVEVAALGNMFDAGFDERTDAAASWDGWYPLVDGRGQVVGLHDHTAAEELPDVQIVNDLVACDRKNLVGLRSAARARRVTLRVD